MKQILKVVLAVASCLAVITCSLAGSNTVPFVDGFEVYSNLTPLIDGTNGWYASDTNCVVQYNIYSTNAPPVGGTNAASIPIDVTLSNRFESTGAITSIWIRMDVRPALYDGQGNPAVDTNATVMFYLNSNGYFVVHDGPVTNWCTNDNDYITGTTAISNSPDDFVRIHLYQNYTTKKWDLFADYNLVTNNIGYINTDVAALSGFDVYNGGGSTTFLDNVDVGTNLPADLAADGGDWLPDVMVSVGGLTSTIFAGQTAAAQSYDVWKTNGFYSLVYTNTLATNWVSVGTSTGTSTNEHDTIAVNYNTAALTARTTPYQATIVVSGRDSRYGFTCTNAPQNVDVDMFVQSMAVDPGVISNSVIAGLNASAKSFDVISTGGGSYNYAITTNDSSTWLSVGSGNGTMTDAQTTSVNVAYSTTALTAGAYTSQFVVASSTGSGTTQTVDMVMNVMELSRAPGGLTNTVLKGADATAQSFDVWNAGSGAMAYTVTTNSGAWLTVSPGTGVSEGEHDTISVSYSTASLAAGTYTSEVSIAANAGGAAQTVQVVLHVTELSVSTGGLTNSVVVGLDATAQSFEVWNSGGGTLGYNISDDMTWLTLAPTTGDSSGEHDTIAATYGTASLEAGAYSGTIIVSGDGGVTQTVAVTLDVMEVSVSVTQLTNSVEYGSAASDQTFEVWNAGSGNMPYTITENETWLSVNPTTGTSTGAHDTITVSYDVSSLEVGTYTGTIAVVADDGGATQTVEVVMSVTMSGVLTVSPTSFSVMVSEGSAAPDQTFEVWNADAGEMDYTVVADQSWMSVTPASGTSTGEHDVVTVALSTTSLTEGTYTGAVTVTAGAQSQAVAVQLQVLPAGPVDALNVDPSQLAVWTRRNFNARTLSFEIWNSGTNALVYSITNNASWMTVSPTSGSSTGEHDTIQVAFSNLNMVGGRYTGTITVTASNGDTNTIDVLLGIGSAPHDFDGDSKSDPWYYYPPTGMWYYRLSSTLKLSRLQFGWAEAQAVPGDYDGDGQTDHAVYHAAEGKWYILTAEGVFMTTTFGFPGTTPMPADYDGDGRTDMGVYYQPEGKWYVMTWTGEYWALQFGWDAAYPITADFDADLKEDFAVYYPAEGMWYIWTWAGDFWALQFGWDATEAMSQDFDGDGKSDLAVYYPAAGMWYVWTWAGNFSGAQFGWDETVPEPADYDGDGLADKGVFYKDLYDATWYLMKSSDGFESISARESRP